MTIKEIIEKYSELAKSSELGENKKVTGLEFSKFEPVKVKAELSMIEKSLQYVSSKKTIARYVDEELSDRLMTGIHSEGLVIRSQSKVDETIFITDTLWCLKNKK